MAMAVNMALMALMKSGIFCTEPFRVPLAGRISHCLFDKTGTLTTDQLVPIGIVNTTTGADTLATFKSNESSRKNVVASEILKKVRDADDEAAMVLAACHSLVVVNNSTDEDDDAEEKDKDATAPVPKPTIPKKEQGPQLAGDPIELAAIKGVEWTWDAQGSAAKPGSWDAMEKAIKILEDRVVSAQQAASAPKPAGVPVMLQNAES